MAARSSLVVFLVVALLAIAGCGGGDSSGSSSQASTAADSTGGTTSSEDEGSTSSSESDGDTTSSESSIETTTSNSDGGTADKAALIKAADAICLKTDETQKAQLATYEKKHSKELSTTAQQEKTLVVVALPPIATEIEELSALSVPQGDEATMTQFIGELEKNLKAAERDPSKLLGLGNPFGSADKIAVKYGFKECAKAE